MANQKISVRFQTPPDENGDRIDMHPVTTSDEVIVNPNSDTPSTLTEVLGQVAGVQIQESQPQFACIWAKPVK